MNGLTKKQRLANVFAGEPVDHTPVLGGWIACADTIAAIMGISLDDYWKDPVTEGLQARPCRQTAG